MTIVDYKTSKSVPNTADAAQSLQLGFYALAASRDPHLADLGAVVGAAAGAIHGDAGEGAASGALYGGTRSGLDADREKQQVFKRCLRGRGYRVLN